MTYRPQHPSSCPSSRRTFLGRIALTTAAAALIREPPPPARAEQGTSEAHVPYVSQGLVPVGDDGLLVEEVYPGDGALAAAKGSIVTVRWVLRRANGYFVAANYGYSGKFDEFTFTAGSDAVIPGFDLGISGIRKGGRRKLVVPPALGYTNPGGPLPAENSARRNIRAHMKENLFFEIYCTKVKPPIESTILPSQ